MIDFLYKDTQNRIHLVSGQTAEIQDVALTTLFERWMNESLSTYAGRRKAIAKLFRIRRNQPIVRNATEIFVPLASARGECAAFVNAMAVVHVEETADEATFVFRSGIVHRAKKPPGLKKRFEAARAIEAYWRTVR